jgi:hypothetical protein
MVSRKMLGSRVEPASPLLLNERHFKFQTISESALNMNRRWFIKTHPASTCHISPVSNHDSGK